jgi:RNA polymerase sigma factor (sigma-70 family)
MVTSFTGMLSFACGDPRSRKIWDHFRKLGRETSFTDLEFLDDELSHKFVPQGFWNHECGPLEWRPEAEVVMHRAEFRETFRNCLSKLPVRVADVFILREIEEMETEQICRDLNISPNNLRVMLHRARMALRECLEMNWFKEPLQEAG